MYKKNIKKQQNKKKSEIKKLRANPGNATTAIKPRRISSYMRVE
jgi:hypothetical protein